MSAARERLSHGPATGRSTLATLVCGALLTFLAPAALGPSAVARADRGGGGGHGEPGAQHKGADQGKGEERRAAGRGEGRGEGHGDAQGQATVPAQQDAGREQGKGKGNAHGRGGGGNGENAPGAEGAGGAHGHSGQGDGEGQSHGQGESGGKEAGSQAKGNGNGASSGKGANARGQSHAGSTNAAPSEGSAKTASAPASPRASAAANVQHANPASPTPAASPALSPTSAAAPAAVSAAAPAAVRSRHVARTHARHPRRGTRDRTAAARRSRAATTAASAIAATGVRAIGARPAPVRQAARTERRAPAQSALPPLARTITKLVSVVPPRVWALIGLLFAMALAGGARSLLAARRSRLLESQRGRLLEDVGLLQAALLPAVPARLGPVAVSAAYRPAEGPGAGGDFYDTFALGDGRVGVIVGDISGHGRGALPHTALVRYTLRAYLEAGLSPREAIKTGGAVLEHQLGESFATALAATYDPRERTLVYASAGHPHPLVAGAEALEPITLASAAPIGIGAVTGTRQTIVGLPGEARVCFHTDGVTEARVGSELYGAGRLESDLAVLGKDASAQALVERVVDATDARPDDMAVCLLSVEGRDAAPRVLRQQIELDADELESERTRRFLRACGVSEEWIASVLAGARAHAQRAGSVLVEVRYEDGAARAGWVSENVTSLRAAGAKRAAAVGASL
jgi:serine phosphatase RsbU (regulator of sigma subunit)